MINYAPFSQRQAEYICRSKDSWLNVAEGGKRAGKNIINLICWAMALDKHPDRLHLAAGVSQSSAKMNIIDSDGFGLEWYFAGRCKMGQYNGRDALIIHSSTGEKVVIIAGGGDSRSASLIKGHSYGTAYITEVNECHKTFFQEVIDRTLASSKRQLFFDLNPKPPSHWFYAEFLDYQDTLKAQGKNDGYNYGHFTILDNKSIPQDALRDALSKYDRASIWYQRDILGKRTSASGRIYTSYNFKDVAISPEKIRRMNDPHYLHTVSMTELYQTAYKSRPPIIDGLLYAGAYILAGAPKIGKSFLVAQLAYHVSTGQRLWGYEVHQGTVLYLALEDDFQRIQSRMFMMYGVADTASLHFATAANKIGNGLDEQLENFIKEHPDTKLVIIDTMQKIREAGGEAYSYASDYEIIGKLKRFADRHSICIVTVHHTRKQPAGDSFETISGTTGLLGCADGALLMQKKKRTALEATVDAVGRDQQDQILYLKKDAGTQIWSLERTENEPYQEPPDPVLDTVSQLVSSESREWTGSPTELAETVNTGMAANALTKYLNVKSGRLLDEYHVKYENRAKHSGRQVKLTYMVIDNVEYEVIE